MKETSLVHDDEFVAKLAREANLTLDQARAFLKALASLNYEIKKTEVGHSIRLPLKRTTNGRFVVDSDPIPNWNSIGGIEEPPTTPKGPQHGGGYPGPSVQVWVDHPVKLDELDLSGLGTLLNDPKTRKL